MELAPLAPFHVKHALRERLMLQYQLDELEHRKPQREATVPDRPFHTDQARVSRRRSMVQRLRGHAR